MTLWSAAALGPREPDALVLCVLENVSCLLFRRECKGHLLPMEVSVLSIRRFFFFSLLILVNMIGSLEYFQVCMLPYPKAFEEGNLQSKVNAWPRLLSLSNLHSPIPSVT